MGVIMHNNIPYGGGSTIEPNPQESATEQLETLGIDGDVYEVVDANAIHTSDVGVVNGVAELDSNGKVPSSQLPSFVDDVVEGYYDSNTDRFYEESIFTTVIPPTEGKSWVDVLTNKSYRWTGSVYVRVDEGVQLGETSDTAYRGDRGKIAYDHSQSDHSGIKPAFTEASTRANIASGETIATIFGKIKKWFSDLKTVAFTGAYSDLSGTPTIPTVNDATLTIQKNGTAVETFTANSSTNKTANITVPTKTSDLTNDSGFVTTDEKVTGEVKNPTASTTYNVPFIGSTNQKPYVNDGLTYATKEGTANNAGWSCLVLGNAVASTSAGSKHGELWLQGDTTNYVKLGVDLGITGNRTINLPDKNGTVALTSDVPSTYAGSSTAGGSATSAESLSTSGTERDYWRGDNTWSNEFKGSLYSGGVNALGKTNVPYHEIAKFEQSTNGAQINTSLHLLVTSFYSPRSRGILSVETRWEVNASSPTWLYCRWLVADPLIDKTALSAFIATWSYNSTTKIATIKLYVYAAGWQSFTFTRLSEPAWGSERNEWTLYRNTNGEGIASIPSGETQVISVNETCANEVLNLYNSNTRPSSANISSNNHGGIRKFLATSSMSTSKPIDDGHIIQLDWDNGSTYASQLFVPNNNVKPMQFRCQRNNNWSSWNTLIDSNSIASYLKKPLYATGSVASGKTGTWKIAEITLSEVGTYYITGWANFTGPGKKAVQLWCSGPLGESWEDSTITSGEPKTFSTFAIYTSSVAGEVVKVNSYTVSNSNAVTGGLIAIKVS